MLRSFLFLVCCSSAAFSEELVEATLRFQIWQPQATVGIVTQPQQVKSFQPLRETFHLAGQPVTCGSLRAGKAISYTGEKQLVLYRQADGGLQRVAAFQLDKSGDYRVLLVPVRDGYQAFPIYQCAEGKHDGSVYLINYSGASVQVEEHEGQKVRVHNRASQWLERKDKSAAATHWTVRVEKEQGWEVAYQRAYVLQADSQAVCFFYKFESDPRVQMQFFSGL